MLNNPSMKTKTDIGKNNLLDIEERQDVIVEPEFENVVK
jgi:hypothetical protein